MEESKLTRYFLIALFLIFIYLAVIVISPLVTSIILALVFSFAFHPIYKRLDKRIKSDNLSASIMLILIILIIILPGIFIVTSLVQQTYSTYAFVQTLNLSNSSDFLPPFISERVDFDFLAEDVLSKIRNFVVNFAPDIIGSIAETMLGLFIMFFIMFYAFRDGDHWVSIINAKLPMKKQYTQKLISNTEKVTSGVLYGYVLTAAIQGFLGGLVFLIVGISNPVFWGFVMMIFAAIPVLGTPIVWLPAALIQLYQGNYVGGIFLLAFGFVILINIDNIIRPKLIGSKTNVHPAIILVGVIGGLSTFGFIGIILGPLILTMLMVIVKFFFLEFNYD